MATADVTLESVLTHFLFKQLLQIWIPDVPTLLAQRIASGTWVFQKTPKSQTPPLISVLMSLADSPATEHETAAKNLPCGHIVDVQTILSCSNLFGGLVWGQGPHFMECPQSDCDTQYALPIIPNPWVVGGLQARLDLIQWAWARSKDAPNSFDVELARILRYFLHQMGYLPQDLETMPNLPWSGPSQRRQRQMFRLLDAETVVWAQEKYYDTPRSLRGTEPYCKFRLSKPPPPGYVQFKYPPPSPGQYCDCEEPHEWARGPVEWASTPAEDEEEWGFAIPRMERSAGRSKRKKTVSFAVPVITAIRYFEPWWRNEYRDSDRYYSSGSSRTSVDPSTKLDDDREIARLDAEALAAGGTKTRRWL
ncbi:MAG: hypothetical protein ALECFALPRED_008312 [Alectoria fallacina]|uniref:Uncharacterized protein n=1 Tax=Alectoria fallacina TaxID=1903189 RepID=A0A8H3EW24_9LECA|nr:MAG: hypothetical protein ALECFALPRED_008312 [Alectoria fallacina]